MRITGTKATGIRLPIVKSGEDLVKTIGDTFQIGLESGEVTLKDNDIITVTESILARAQGNYISLDAVTKELKEKYKNKIGVLFPMLSRNRFSNILHAIFATELPVVVMLNYPSDEVGNHLMDPDVLFREDINPYSDILTEEQYREIAGSNYYHPFTGVDYVDMYKSMAVKPGQIEIVFANNPSAILNYTDEVLVCNIHDRKNLKKKLEKKGAKTALALDDICTKPNGQGYNPEYGLLGSNLSSSSEIKLFPRDSYDFAKELQSHIKQHLGVHVEVMVYGDGAFKDPIGKIWELADPVVSPGFTEGLSGMPNEIKLKYIADNELKELRGEDLTKAMRDKIKNKSNNLTGQEESLGTTPRHLTDLLGSLSDLMSGSGDKGTPVILIQGYFDNYATE